MKHVSTSKKFQITIDRTDYILHTMHYKKGGEEHYGYFPDFLTGINHVITWGKKAKNMSPTVGGDTDKAGKRNLTVMRKNGIKTDNIVRINPSMKVSDDKQILELTKNHLPPMGGFTYDTGANFIYTFDPDITAIVRPGDCTVSIIRGLTSNGQGVLGLLHAGREHLDANLPYRAIIRLLELGINPESIQIGVTPSMEDYFIPAQTSLPHDKNALIDLQKWINTGFAKIHSDKHQGIREQRIYLDIRGMLLHQFEESGIPKNSKHLRVYGIDTYSSEGEGFSHRRATIEKTPERNGRFLVAAQLAA